MFDIYNITEGQYNLFSFFPIMSLFGIILLFVIMIYCYLKIRIFLVILVIYLFSLVIGVLSFNESIIPFTPYLQIFFLLFQTTIFFLVAKEVFVDGKEKF